MKLSDLVCGLLLLALAAGILVHVSAFPNIRGQNIGPAAFPRLLALLLGACALLLVLRGWRVRAAEPLAALAAWVRSPTHLLRFVLAIAAVLAYARWSETLGFILSALLLMLPVLLSLQVRWRSALLIAGGLTLVVHLVFYSLLRVPLPWGVLEALTR